LKNRRFLTRPELPIKNGCFFIGIFAINISTILMVRKACRGFHKLVEERQSEQQQKQAGHSITMFYRMKYNPVASTEALQQVNSSAILVRYQSAPLSFVPPGITETVAKPLTPANSRHFSNTR
jgi:hypothetical protein